MNIIKERINSSLEDDLRNYLLINLIDAEMSIEANLAPSKSCLKLSGASPDYFKKKKETFTERLFKIIRDNDLDELEVYKNAYLDRRLFSKIRSSDKYNPSKNTAVLLCFSLKLDTEDALDLLSLAGYTLSYSIKEDLVIRYFLDHKNYDILELNNALYSLDLKLILK